MMIEWNGKSVSVCYKFSSASVYLIIFQSVVPSRQFGTVIAKKPKSIRVQFDEFNVKVLQYPSDVIEKLETTMQDSAEHYYPEKFCVGDIVDTKYKDEDMWYRGRIADVSQDGHSCDVLYYDKDVS